MSWSEDDWGKPFFPTRFGSPQGHATERKMLDAVGGFDGIRTKIRTNPDGSTTILKTRGGMPVFTTTIQKQEASGIQEYLFAVECPGNNAGYSVASPLVSYVRFSSDGSGRQTIATPEKYYAESGLSCEWWDAAGKRVVFNGIDNRSFGYLSGMRGMAAAQWATAALPAAGAAVTTKSSMAFAPPGTPVGLLPWGTTYPSPLTSGFTDTRQFSGFDGGTYAGSARVDGTLPTAEMDVAFVQSGAMHTLFVPMDTMSTTVSGYSMGAPETVFGYSRPVAGGASVTLQYAAVPSGGFGTSTSSSPNHSFSSGQSRAITVSSDGARAVQLGAGYWRRDDAGTFSAVAVMLDANLSTGQVDVLSGDSCLLQTGAGSTVTSGTSAIAAYSFRKVAGVERLSFAYKHAYTASSAHPYYSAVFLDEVPIACVPAGFWGAYVAHRDIHLLYSDIPNELFIVAMEMLNPSETEVYDNQDFSLYYEVVVVYKGAKLYAFALTLPRTGSYGPDYAPILPAANHATGLMQISPALATPWTGTQVPLKGYDVIGSSSWSRVDNIQVPPFACIAALDKRKGKVAFSLVTAPLSDLLYSNDPLQRLRTNYSGLTHCVNKVVTVATGSATDFGSSDMFYNRLHYQEVAK